MIKKALADLKKKKVFCLPVRVCAHTRSICQAQLPIRACADSPVSRGGHMSVPAQDELLWQSLEQSLSNEEESTCTSASGLGSACFSVALQRQLMVFAPCRGRTVARTCALQLGGDPVTAMLLISYRLLETERTQGSWFILSGEQTVLLFQCIYVIYQRRKYANQQIYTILETSS